MEFWDRGNGLRLRRCSALWSGSQYAHRRCSMNSLVREPAVAGQFYPGRPDRLRREVEQYTEYAGPKVRAIGCVAPHAGYMYSGHVAGAVYARLELPQRFVILCPNHTGMGQPLAMMSSGAWTTPLGDVGIDEALADSLRAACDLLAE